MQIEGEYTDLKRKVELETNEIRDKMQVEMVEEGIQSYNGHNSSLTRKLWW
jgi:hypothetical protein